MNIEYALYIIETTNYYTCFSSEEHDEAFDMAYRALKLFRDYKKEIKDLERIKGDRLAHVIANQFRIEIEKLEGSGDDGN